jgi:Beta-lactamase class C and other penicillin binding proteins
MRILLRATLFAATLLLFACSKDNGLMPEPEKFDKAFINQFRFLRADNSQLSLDCPSFLIDRTLFITVPAGTDLNNLKADFMLSEKATLQINGAAQVSGSSQADYSNLVKFNVISGDGKTNNTYYVNVRHGIWNLDQHVYAFMKEYSIPGVSISVAQDEGLVYTQSYGYADKEQSKRVESNTLFRLASMSKAFTALSILRLMEEGKLKLSDKPFAENGVLVPEFGVQKGFSADITIQMLLEHNAGWESDTEFTTAASGRNSHDLIAYTLTSMGFSNTPGTVYSYSNISYSILGHIVETLSGLGFEDYLKSSILKDAGITDIHIGGDRSQRRPNETIYYSQDGRDGYGNNMTRIRSLGALIASTPELMQFLTHIDGGTKVPDIISPETRAIMLTPSKAYNRYALGWRVNHSMFPGAAYHGGNLAGTGTLWVMGHQNRHAVILCNSRSYKSGFDDELYVLLQTFTQRSY